MPLFEFVCESCSQESELLVRNSETPACPECGSKKLNKLLSAPFGHAGTSPSLPIAGACPPADAPPCSPRCCRIPGQ